MNAVVFDGAGGNEVVSLQQRPDPVPGPEDVIVAQRYAALNPADVLQRLGRYPAPPGSIADIPGLEVCGTVEAIGRQVASLRTGDRVFGLVGGGGLADRVRVHERCVAKVPEGLSDTDAAAIAEACITAHDAARTQAGLAPGEVLLVHGASGAVGDAAVQIGLLMGARVFGTARSDASRSVIAQRGATALPVDNFVDVVNGAGGANVIVDLVGAPNFPANIDALARKGRIVLASAAAGAEINLSIMAIMVKRATILGTVLRARPLEEKAAAVQAFARELSPALASGRLRPVVDSVHPAEKIADALDRVAASGKRGKVLIEFS